MKWIIEYNLFNSNKIKQKISGINRVEAINIAKNKLCNNKDITSYILKNKDVDFKKIECNYKDDLEKYLEDGYEIYEGKNEISTISNDSEIVVVGSFIPQSLIYFYNENPYIYNGIDSQRKTKLSIYKKQYPLDLSTANKERIIYSIKEILSKEKIAFVDLSKFVLTKRGSNIDKDIKGIVVDKKILNIIKESKNIKRVISVSEAVEDYLFQCDIDNIYIKLFAGKSLRFPKGSNYEKNWTDAFNLDKTFKNNLEV